MPLSQQDYIQGSWDTAPHSVAFVTASEWRGGQLPRTHSLSLHPWPLSREMGHEIEWLARTRRKLLGEIIPFFIHSEHVY